MAKTLENQLYVAYQQAKNGSVISAENAASSSSILKQWRQQALLAVA